METRSQEDKVVNKKKLTTIQFGNVEHYSFKGVRIEI
jgi:hypothetical protein